MGRWSQLGIAVGVLGIVITLIGLFPSITGLEASPGIGLVQILTILTGFTTLIAGAYIFVQVTYYSRVKHNLAQQIGVRLSLTGLIISAAAGLADVLGYGSNPPGPEQRPVLGVYQSFGLIGGFVIASLGILIFTLMGSHSGPPDEPGDP